MKYKVLLLEKISDDLLDVFSSDFVVDCIDKEFVKSVNKSNFNYINYKNYLSSSNLDNIINELDKYRDYSFIISNSSVSDKVVSVDKLKDINIDKNFTKKKLNLLINGYDLKFIKDLVPMLENIYNVTLLQHDDYLVVNKEECINHLKYADIVWCEWLVENAKWFSNNIYSHQKLIIRAHRFEVNKKYGYKLNIDNVYKIVTVGYYYYEEFMKTFNIPRSKMTVIPNFIDTNKYSVDKKGDYKHNIAIIGSLPKRKGLHRAIKILFELKKRDFNYKLHVLGLNPSDLSSTKFDSEESKYYEEVLRDIKLYNLDDDVIFTGWVDTKEYLKNIGYVLSVSDNEKPESFHITPAEGMVSGAISLATYWEGIEYIYPDYVVKKDVKDIVNTIIDLDNNDRKYKDIANKGRDFIIDNYDIQVVYKYFEDLLEGIYEK